MKKMNTQEVQIVSGGFQIPTLSFTPTPGLGRIIGPPISVKPMPAPVKPLPFDLR